MTMIDSSSRAAVDRAIDEALDRIRGRAADLGGGLRSLADAIQRAAEGGKRLRPELVVAAFDAFDGDPADRTALYPVAAAFELLHTAFVVHDDVIDHDTVRRGVPNIGGEFRSRGRTQGADAAGAALLGDAAGILAGDLLLHEASRLITLADVGAARRRRLLDLVDQAVYVSAAGELADVENAVAPEAADADTILDATFKKTAVYSFQAPLCAGAVLAGASDPCIDALERAGGRLGLAFQLVDDLIGAIGSAAQAGRDEGGDLREAKRTPLVALARESASWDRVNDALALAPTGPIAVREAQRALAESGAIARLRRLVIDTLDEARHDDPALPQAGRRLVSELARLIEGRIP